MKFNYLKKILLVMRLTIFLIVLTILEAGAKTALSQVNLNARHSSLSSVLSSIKQQTGYVFVTGDLDLDQTRVDVKINNASIENALDACLSGTKLEYKIVDKTVFIKQKEETVIDKIKDALHLDKIDVHGRVAGEDGQPLAGATVFVKGTSNSTITDVNGYFILKSVVQDATISISFVGYDKNEVKAQSELGAIKMVQAHSKLDEVKVIAYGQTSERLSVGNSATITSKDIEKQPVSNPILALEGQVPGLFIVQSSGIPGSSVSVQVQGQNSIHNGNDPFYVVDGVPFSAGFRSDGYQTIGSNSPLNLINPSDIESISVLKDADATAIYGSRAANGAIIITTKKGKAGTAIVNIKLQDGWGHITREAPLQDISQYLQMRQEALKNDGLTVATTDVDINGILDTTRNVNWQKELIGGTAKYTNLNASISGGSENTQFYVGTTYHRESTVFPTDLDDKKANIHFNISTASANKKFHFQLSGSYLFDDNHFSGADLTDLALTLPPDAPPLLNPDGSFNWALDKTGNSNWDFIAGEINPLTMLYPFKGVCYGDVDHPVPGQIDHRVS